MPKARPAMYCNPTVINSLKLEKRESITSTSMEKTSSAAVSGKYD